MLAGKTFDPIHFKMSWLNVVICSKFEFLMCVFSDRSSAIKTIQKHNLDKYKMHLNRKESLLIRHCLSASNACYNEIVDY